MTQSVFVVDGHLGKRAPVAFKRGTFVRRATDLRNLSAEELARIPEQHRPDGPVLRSSVEALDMPPFNAVTNREAVVFDGADPTTKGE